MRISHRTFRFIASAALALLLFLPSASFSRAGGTPQYQAAQPEPESKAMRELQRQQEKARNAERHKDLKQDTDKLLELATELKTAVDNSNENTLSMDVIKKAEQIEKLSKNVQRKMRGY